MNTQEIVISISANALKLYYPFIYSSKIVISLPKLIWE